MSGVEVAAASISPPTSNEVYARTTVTSSERVAIPDGWTLAYVTFQAETSAVKIVFGGSTVAADASARSGLTAEALSLTTSTVIDIPANSERSFDMRNLGATVTHFAHISADTSGVLRMYKSSGGNVA